MKAARSFRKRQTVVDESRLRQAQPTHFALQLNAKKQSGVMRRMASPATERRAKRALDRQLAYQRRKASNVRGHEQQLMASMASHSLEVRQKLETVKPIPESASVLEVGSGAHGLIFYFEGAERFGIDPLADDYRALFPAWQERATTIAAFGEDLPFENGRFDVVLCDNVVDHAGDPRKIVEEIARVLRPGGLLYFTVNVHHPIYQAAAAAHAAWQTIGIPLEITPFADHTVHLTLAAARRLFAGLPFEIRVERHDIEDVKREGPGQARHPADLLKHLFFKNARYELIAECRAA